MVLEVRVQPKAGRNSLEMVGASFHGRMPLVRVRVTAAPEGCKANDAVVALLGKRLGVAKSRVIILKGHSARYKVLQVTDMTVDEVIARLSTR